MLESDPDFFEASQQHTCLLPAAMDPSAEIEVRCGNETSFMLDVVTVAEIKYLVLSERSIAPPTKAGRRNVKQDVVHVRTCCTENVVGGGRLDLVGMGSTAPVLSRFAAESERIEKLLDEFRIQMYASRRPLDCFKTFLVPETLSQGWSRFIQTAEQNKALGAETDRHIGTQ